MNKRNRLEDQMGPQTPANLMLTEQTSMLSSRTASSYLESSMDGKEVSDLPRHFQKCSIH